MGVDDPTANTAAAGLAAKSKEGGDVPDKLISPGHACTGRRGQARMEWAEGLSSG